MLKAKQQVCTAATRIGEASDGVMQHVEPELKLEMVFRVRLYIFCFNRY